MKKTICIFLCILSVIFSGCSKKGDGEVAEKKAADKAETIALRIGAGHTADRVQWTYMVDKFFSEEVSKRVSERTDYEIEWVEAYGGSAAKLGEVLEAIEMGLLDIGFIVYVFEPSKLMLQSMTYRMPFQESDPLKVAEVGLKLYEAYPENKEIFQEFNQTFLGLAVSDPYNIYANYPIRSVDDLKGHKIGGAGSNLAWIDVPGAAAVQSNLNEGYTCLQTGVYDGIIDPTGAAYDLKHHEVAPYLIEAHFGSQLFGAITINNDTLKKLPEEVVDILVEVGQEYAMEEAKYVAQRYEKDKEGILADGSQIITLSLDARKEWANAIPNSVSDLVNELDSNGLRGTEIVTYYYEEIEKLGYEPVRDWFK